VLLQGDRAIIAPAVFAAADRTVHIASSLSLSLSVALSSVFPEVSLFLPLRFYRFVQSPFHVRPACAQTEL
jgi:hypothetical protein